jgi:hypothetical protein
MTSTMTTNGGDGDNDDGEVEHDGDDNVNDDEDVVNIDVVEDDKNDGTTTMRWQRGQMDDNDAMAMGG